MPTNQTLALQPFDGIFDIWNMDYSVINVLIKNGHAGTVTITQEEMRMLPVVYTSGLAVLTAAANANTYNAIILDTDGDVTAVTTGSTSTIYAYLLVRGPAIIKNTTLTLVDADDAAITLATVKTALLACSPPIVLQDENTNTIAAPV